jgi:PAS domain-containing protein
LSRRLTEAVDRLIAGAKREIGSARGDALAVQRFGSGLLVGTVSLSLVSSLLIVWLYVGGNLIRRLTALSGSMLAIAGGNLRAPLPAAGGDEIGRMAEALAVFRDTAVEVEENKLREIAQARQRLIDAIESINEGFAFYDAEDRLVLCNTRYRDLLHPGDGAAELRPGTPFATIIRGAVGRGLIDEAKEDPEAYVRQRLEYRRNPGPPRLQRRSDGTWVLISERKVAGGGTVAVYSDLTELKENERRAATANRLILDSLRYASRIQAAVLPPRGALAAVAADHFLLWEPRDIVGGDFYWFRRVRGGHLVMLGDCTGHGVPGAFMTLIATGLLDRLARDLPGEAPGRLLAGLHRELQGLLGQHEGAGETDDGLEAGLCFLDEGKSRLVFAGARFSLWRARGGEVQEIRGARAGVGFSHVAADAAFGEVGLELAPGDRLYLTTDGLTDQVGGARRRSFGKRRFARFIAEHHARPMAEQGEALRYLLVRYQGEEARRDDVTALGFVPLGN